MKEMQRQVPGLTPEIKSVEIAEGSGDLHRVRLRGWLHPGKYAQHALGSGVGNKHSAPESRPGSPVNRPRYYIEIVMREPSASGG
jgi:hypothetical protein